MLVICRVTLIQSIFEPICYQTRAMFIAWELFSWRKLWYWRKLE
ncbi:hypothetical protein IHE45_17G055400 [Dioscorea alata]|uniref:Uncharacterized protein n=1 Tax=Dioscorea alata TaxID=55571 RepID=A0ACB7UCF6_DIOAL|nr:hypothetical protein IHE45_17G055400 [Dioscorea alata]